MIDIKIREKAIGWLDLTIKDKTFTVSYLSDFINDMQILLDLNDSCRDMKVNRTYLDGEGIDLYLTAWKSDKHLMLAWEVWEDDLSIELMQFNYQEFVEEFNQKFEVVRDVYFKQFDLDSVLGKN